MRLPSETRRSASILRMISHWGAQVILESSALAWWHTRSANHRREPERGQHVSRLRTLCARFGLNAWSIWCGRRRAAKAGTFFAMKMLGAEVRPVVVGFQTLKDARRSARDWYQRDRYVLCIGRLRGRTPIHVVAISIDHRQGDA